MKRSWARTSNCGRHLLRQYWSRRSVKVWPGGGCSEEYCGMQDNQRCLEPGPELWCVKGTKHKAWTEVQRPATLVERMERRGVASSKSNVVGS
jgi:hypothetical protein